MWTNFALCGSPLPCKVTMGSLAPMSAVVRMWRASSRLHRRGHRRLARALKAINFFVFHAVLPPEVDVPPDIKLEHYGLGVVVHPNTRFGSSVQIWQHVTIGANSAPGSGNGVVVGDRVMLGAGATVIAGRDETLRVGDRARIGPGVVVLTDVPGGTVIAPP
jgi:serine O-acetyltransferase